MTSQETILERFARFVADTPAADIPERVLAKVRLQVLTSLTAARFSQWHPGAAMALLAEERAAGGQEACSTVIATGGRLPAENAACANAAYAMTLDFDDYMLMGHTGYSAVLPALAYLERSNGTVGDLLASAALTNEVMGRLSLACFLGPLNGQMWSYIHNLGGAAGACRAQGLSRDVTRNAMALSLYQPNFCLAPGFWHEGAKLLTSAVPLRVGLWAARYARAGLSGPENIVEGPLGFFHFFAFCPVPEFTGDLGRAWLSDSLSYKRFPGTSYINAPVEAALGALFATGRKRLADPGEVKGVTVDTTFLSYSLENVSRAQGLRELTAIAVNFSVSLSVAYALLQGDLAPDHFREEEMAVFADRIRALAAKVRVRHDLALSARTVATFPMLGAVLAKANRGQLARMRDHFKALNGPGAGGRGIPDGLSARGLLGFAKNALKLAAARKRPIRLSDVPLDPYPMLQSARVRVEWADAAPTECEVPIPTGGSGTDEAARREWVAERTRRAFGVDPERILGMLENPRTPVREFVRALVGG